MTDEILIPPSDAIWFGTALMKRRGEKRAHREPAKIMRTDLGERWYRFVFLPRRGKIVPVPDETADWGDRLVNVVPLRSCQPPVPPEIARWLREAYNMWGDG